MITTDTRTFTLTESQLCDVIDSIQDRIESLEMNCDSAWDLHTLSEVTEFKGQIEDLRAIIAILES